MSVLYKSNKPVHSQITTLLRKRADSGMWKANEKIESEGQLAKEFNVSRSTVKKALKQLEAEGLLASLQGKGRFLIEGAFARQRKQTSVIGVGLFELGHLAHPVSSRHIAGIEDVLKTSNYHLKIFALNDENAEIFPSESNILGPFSDMVNASGAIFIAPSRVDIRRLLEVGRHIPVVWLGHKMLNQRVKGLLMDPAGGMFSATKHLWDIGHRRIALVTAKESVNWIGREHWDGVRLAFMGLLSSNNKGGYKVFQVDSWSKAEGRRAARLVLSDVLKPTAVICGAPELTFGVFEEFHARRISIPGDMSLVGMSDVYTLEQIPIAMTVIDMKEREVGTLACKRLLRMLAEPDVDFDAEEVCEAKLIVRESTAPPRK
ncbi:MAG: LacI family DNA-binding transcriptional regulator [Planctomycetota bacterium]